MTLRRASLGLVAVSMIIIASGCATRIEDYAGETPRFAMEEFFSGELRAWGVFQDRSGKVVRRFTVDMTGRWDGDTGVLEEDFVFADGKTDRRVWTFTKTGTDTYSGTADDVVGEASGVVAGNALRWKYQLLLPVEDKTYKVTFDDWMYLLDENRMVNRSVMTKFGVRLGEVILFFEKVGSPT